MSEVVHRGNLRELRTACDRLGIRPREAFVVMTRQEYEAPDQLSPRRARARGTDPSTSHDAADSVGPLRPRQEAVLKLLRERPMIDQELVRIYEARRIYPLQSVSGIRTRRCELVDRGDVIDTGQRRKTASGRNSIVWGTAS